MSTIYVPFPRALERGSSGIDVKAVKRALIRAGFGKRIVVDPVMRRGAINNLHRFQEANALPAGNYTRQTHLKLARYFDAKGAWQMAQEVSRLKQEAALAKRELVVAAAMLGYHNRAAIHYTQGFSRWQGMTNRLRPPRFPTWADCSSFATWCYYAADLPDPNGQKYTAGFTGTLAQHGRSVTRANARPGDLVFYGTGAPWKHVAIYIGGGRVVSHGSESGPNLVGIDYRSDRGDIRSYIG